MTRTLIDAKAWQTSRAQVCTRCAHFEISSPGVQAYSWDNCQRQTSTDDADNFSKWDKGHCRYFTPRQKPQ